HPGASVINPQFASHLILGEGPAVPDAPGFWRDGRSGLPPRQPVDCPQDPPKTLKNPNPRRCGGSVLAARETEIADAAGAEQESGHSMFAVEGKTDRAHIRREYVANPRLKSVGFVLEAREREFSVLNAHVIHRLDLLAHIIS